MEYEEPVEEMSGKRGAFTLRKGGTRRKGVVFNGIAIFK